MKNTKTAYGLIAKLFHWLIFIMITIAVIAGNFIDSLPKGQEKIDFINTHKAIGIVILSLVLLRLLWKLINTTPDHVEGVSSAQSFLSDAMHWGLYVLMAAQPISGLLMSQASGYPVNVFGMGTVPTLVEKSKDLAGIFHEAHEIIWVLLVIAIVGHAAAALHHHFIAKNETLKRMSFHK